MDSSNLRRHEGFRTTHWSLVAAAAKQQADLDDADLEPNDQDDPITDDTPDDAPEDALAQLCQSYWYPVYSFIRHSGLDRGDAEDLTQGFFTRLLEKRVLADADSDRGRFRTFLLSAVKHFIANEQKHANAVKRGGRTRLLSIDFEQAASRYDIEPVEGWTPEAIYDRNWALSLLSEVLSNIEAEYESAGKLELFAALSPHLTGQAEESYAQIAKRLDMSVGAVKVAAYRLRSSYKESLLQSVSHTLEGSENAHDERNLLLDALCGKGS
ncbi:MAG: RNA polymerase sigma factor [Rubripirellula sp.]